MLKPLSLKIITEDEIRCQIYSPAVCGQLAELAQRVWNIEQGSLDGARVMGRFWKEGQSGGSEQGTGYRAGLVKRERKSDKRERGSPEEDR